MAVQDKYVDANLAAGKRGNPAFSHGAQPFAMISTFEVAAADDNLSVYRIGFSLQPNLIPIYMRLHSDAITSSTDWDLGLYKPGIGGAEVDKDIFADGIDLAAGYVSTSAKDGLVTVDIANLYKRIYEHAGHTILTKLPAYDLALTANVVGSAAGTVTLIAMFIQG